MKISMVASLVIKIINVGSREFLWPTLIDYVVHLTY